MSDERREHRFTLEIYKREPQGEHLATVPVRPDFDPVLEWAHFWAACHDPTRPLVLDGPNGRIEPCWDEQRSQPYLGGLRAIVPVEGKPAVELDIPLRYFRGLARAASAQLVESGQLAVGEVFEYRVCAYPTTRRHSEDRTSGGLGVDFMPQEVPMEDRALDEFLAGSAACGEADAGWIPVFVPRDVLEEVTALMQQAEDVETGGILIGHLHRDRRHGAFLEVTAQVPAEHAEHELIRLTFTPDTWAAVDAALALRGRREMYVGWWHTHPVGAWCQQCPPETRAKCRAAGTTPGDFFSTHDAALHLAVFPRAYSVALVLSGPCQAGAGPTPSLYGWRYGMVEARGFRILDTAPQAAPAATSTRNEGENNNATIQ